MNQQIRFARSFDAARIAYAISGEGPLLVKAPHWLTHLEYETQSPLWLPWIESLSSSYTLLRSDLRGCGLSDRESGDFSFDTWVRDLEAVIDDAGFEKFALLGHSQGAAIAIDYCVRHPERVSKLVLLGGYARGALKRDPSPEKIAELEALLRLIELGWGRDDPSYRQIFSTQFVPGGSLEQINSMSEMQRRSTTAPNAVLAIREIFSIDVRAAAAQLRCPTLIVHARGDRRAPFDEGLMLAGMIPNARMVILESDNHILVPQDHGFGEFFEELRSFVPATDSEKPKTAFAQLTSREAEVLDLLARGLDNAQIAAHLEIAEKTVRNNITRLFDKLGVENRPQAIVLARDNGLGKV